MGTLKNKKNIPFGISLPPEIVDSIDFERGDVSRSRFLLRILEKVCEFPSERKKDHEKNIPANNSSNTTIDRNVSVSELS